MSSIMELTEKYVAGPELARKAIVGMTAEHLLARPIPGKWSTQEVICHLADSDAAWAHRIKCAIAEERPLLLGYDETRFARGLAYDDRDVQEELALLEGGRRQVGRILRTLGPDALRRTAVHNERGLLTLEEMLQTMISHIAHHVKFILEKRLALGLAPSETS